MSFDAKTVTTAANQAGNHILADSQALSSADKGASQGWKQLFEEDGVPIFENKKHSGRCAGFVDIENIDADLLFEHIADFDKRRAWDQAVNDKWLVIAKDIAPATDVIHAFIPGQLSMAGRYFVSARIILPAGQGNASTVNADDKTSVMALTAVDGPVPSTIDTSGLVRGTQHDVGCVLVKTSDTSARVYWFVQTTLGGWMMIDVTKMTARSVHRLLLQLKQFAATLKK